MAKLNSRIFIRFVLGNRKRKFGLFEITKNIIGGEIDLSLILGRPRTIISKDSFAAYLFSKSRTNDSNTKKIVSNYDKPSHITDNKI